MKHHQVAGAVVKGLAAGAVVGTAAYMIAGNSKKKTASMIKKNAGKALRLADNNTHALFHGHRVGRPGHFHRFRPSLNRR